MRRQQDLNSIEASISEFCSVGQRISHSNREQQLTKQNSRLRRQYSEISEKYIKMCNQLSKCQKNLIDKQRKIMELDLLYKKQMEQLKKQLSLKTSQLSRLQKKKALLKNPKNKENQSENIKNSEYLQNCFQNQSIVLQQVHHENSRLHQLLQSALQIFETHFKSKQYVQVLKRVTSMKRQLQEKGSLDSIYQKTNAILEETRNKSHDNNQNQIGRLLGVLKSKSNQLKKIPLTFDYDVESEYKKVEVLMADIDIQMRLLGKKENKS